MSCEMKVLAFISISPYVWILGSRFHFYDQLRNEPFCFLLFCIVFFIVVFRAKVLHAKM